MLNVWWHLSEYISHRRAGMAYRDCLCQTGYGLVDDPALADVVVLHEDPIFWPDILRRFPEAAGKMRIGYAVWEAQDLPDVYRENLGLVEEVWTASEFSTATLRQGHGRVRILPHVVNPAPCEAVDTEWAGTRLALSGKPYFFSIVDASNPRKNLDALLRVFSRVHHATGGQIALVVKQYRRELSLGNMPHVISIGENLTDGQLAALHQGALAYISPHRGEAWGLGLSEAMSHGKTVLATGWSGNMAFMDTSNSVPLRYALEPVGSRMAKMLPHFRPDMLWAVVDEGHLEREMLRLVRRGPDPDLCGRAAGITERFSLQRVARILDDLLREMCTYSRNI